MGSRAEPPVVTEITRDYMLSLISRSKLNRLEGEALVSGGFVPAVEAFDAKTANGLTEIRAFRQVGEQLHNDVGESTFSFDPRVKFILAYVYAPPNHNPISCKFRDDLHALGISRSAAKTAQGGITVVVLLGTKWF